MRNRWRWTSVAAAAVLTGFGTGQDREAVREPATVTVVGASVSAGFVDPRLKPDGDRNSTTKLAKAMQTVWSEDRAGVRDRSDTWTFQNPQKKQAKRIEKAQGDQPDLLIAVDFMFWFGYGAAFGGKESRFTRQQGGFEYLERFDVPMLVGDYPDMHGADRLMLPPHMIPETSTIAELNRRVRAWADARDNVIFFPLSAFVAKAKTDGIEVSFEGKSHVLPAELLLQSDKLHASKPGMAVLTMRIRDALRAGLPEGHPLRPTEASFEEIAEACGATEDILDWVDMQDDGKRGDGAGKRGGRQPSNP